MYFCVEQIGEEKHGLHDESYEGLLSRVSGNVVDLFHSETLSVRCFKDSVSSNFANMFFENNPDLFFDSIEKQ